MITQKLTQPTVWAPGSGGTSANAIAISAYADRGMTDGETLWVQAIPADYFIGIGAPGSTATSANASTGCTIDILINNISVGSVSWANGATEGTFTWNNPVTGIVGDTISFKVIVADFDMTDFTIQLIGDLI
jgi:hypothetical protein